MRPAGKKKIVLLGLMSKMPVAGVVWQTVHYVVGFERLGYATYYVEAHGITPTKLMRGADDDSSARAAEFISSVAEQYGFGDRWAFHALHEPEARCYGLSESQLLELYDAAELIINLHGGTTPLAEHSANGRLIYLETDPVRLQIELHDGVQKTIDFLAPHSAFFTFGENYGNPDCKLPPPGRFEFKPTRQPVVLDFWQPQCNGTPPTTFTTVGNWQQPWRDVVFEGEVYRWSKHYEFGKFLDLPRRTRQAFELALDSYDGAALSLLEEHGWRVRPARGFSSDFDAYRHYIMQSRGEWTVAKDQNVRLRSGWFSDRSATYLAAGRPVITQETGFSNIIPTGDGLFAFSSSEEAERAVERVNLNYEHHCRAASDLARGYFGHDVVLGRLLSEVGV